MDESLPIKILVPAIARDTRASQFEAFDGDRRRACGDKQKEDKATNRGRDAATLRSYLVPKDNECTAGTGMLSLAQGQTSTMAHRTSRRLVPWGTKGLPKAETR